MHHCNKEPHYHILLRLYDSSSGNDVYMGTIETHALYAYNTDESNVSIVKDIIDYWRNLRHIPQNTVATIEWKDVVLDPNMLLRDIEVDGVKIPLHSCLSNDFFILRYTNVSRI